LSYIEVATSPLTVMARDNNRNATILGAFAPAVVPYSWGS
jgi:hypothetical protein